MTWRPVCEVLQVRLILRWVSIPEHQLRLGKKARFLSCFGSARAAVPARSQAVPYGLQHAPGSLAAVGNRTQGNIRYRLKTPYRDGTTDVVFEPLDKIAGSDFE